MKKSGYMHCSCRDCFELIVGVPGDMCDGCMDAGCQPDQECQNPDSYFWDEEESP